MSTTFTRNASTISSTWLALVASANKGNSGPRLQIGKTVTTGGTIWKNRGQVIFSPVMDVGVGDIPPGATIVSATIALTVRAKNSCFAKGTAPAIYISRFAVPDDVAALFGNAGATAECTASTSGDSYPGVTTTATHRASWSGTPAIGDVITVTITSLFQDWAADGTRTNTAFGVVITAQDENDTTQAIAFDNAHGSNPPVLTVVYTTDNAPTIPATDTHRSPASAARVTGTTSRTFMATFEDADPADMTAGPSSVEVIVDDDPAFGSPLYSGAAAPTYNSTTHVWTRVISMTQVRGTTYYWKYRTQDAAGAWSPYSSSITFSVNRLPVNTKVRPT